MVGGWFQPVVENAGWLADHHGREPDGPPIDAVADRRRQTEALGAKPLWDGYRQVTDYPRRTGGDRSAAQVGTKARAGRIYAWLAARRAPDVIVEFGAAFGVSGMYWLTGLEAAGRGRLMSYEPNAIWADIAEENFRSISDRFILHRGTFEDLAASTLTPETVDIAFVDAIHTRAFVEAQFAILRPFLKPGALVLFDDIDFSDDMAACWQALARSPWALASGEIGQRVGILEYRPV
jgi:predicted O-methyltransferase YrrM